jgi:hypothetical protein
VLASPVSRTPRELSLRSRPPPLVARPRWSDRTSYVLSFLERDALRLETKVLGRPRRYSSPNDSDARPPILRGARAVTAECPSGCEGSNHQRRGNSEGDRCFRCCPVPLVATHRLRTHPGEQPDVVRTAIRVLTAEPTLDLWMGSPRDSP